MVRVVSQDAFLVSVIIPTKNSERTLRGCLGSIRAQTYQNVEILVIDANSSDKTQEIAREYGAKILPLEGERTKAKNYGLQKASGKYVLFLDSDMALQDTVIEECMNALYDGTGGGGVVIPERSVGEGYWVKVRDFERSLYAGSKIESARFFRKDLAIKAGGFDEDVVFFEESTLPQRIESLGLDVNARRISSCILHDEGNFDLRKWLSKKKYYSDTARSYREKYRYAESQTSVSYRLKVFTSNGRWKLLLKNPFLSPGLFILKTLELISSRAQKSGS